MNKNIKPLVGKTIKSINTRAINCWKIEFTNGDYIELWAEMDGPLGIPNLYVDAFNDRLRNNPPKKKTNPRKRIKVNIIESEAGWGRKIDSTRTFETLAEAERFIKKYNKSNVEKFDKTGVVPSWYMVAELDA
jgi:hypothetical protein